MSLAAFALGLTSIALCAEPQAWRPPETCGPTPWAHNAPIRPLNLSLIGSVSRIETASTSAPAGMT